jgi:hypothetical protein
LSSGCLPGDEDYGSLINGQARFDYYWDFYQARMAEGNGVFIVDFGARNTTHRSSIEDQCRGISLTIFSAAASNIRQRNWRWILPKRAPDPPRNLRITAVGSDWVEITFE